MKKILVTDGEYKHTLAIVRSLGKSGYEVDCIGTSICLSRYSKYLNKVSYPKSKFNELYFDDFLKFIKENNYSVIIPVGAKSVHLISKNRDKIEKYSKIILAPKESIEIALRKDLTSKIAKEVGIKVPRIIDNNDNLLSDESLNYPLVVKSKSEISKKSPVYVNSYEELLTVTSNYESDYLIQEFIEGDGLGFFALYNHGVCRSIFMHKRIREDPPTGGSSSCAVSVYQEDLLFQGRRLLDTLKWHGVAMVEFKRNKNSQDLYLMEINPKFWGSLDLAIESGVDFPLLLVEMAINDSNIKSFNYKIGLKYHWPVNEEINHLFKRPSSFIEIIKDILNPNVYSNVKLSDPLPSFMSVLFKVLRPIRFLLIKIGLLGFIYRVKNIGLYNTLLRLYTESTGIPIISCSAIDENIFVGAQHGGKGKKKLSKLGITAILNVRQEMDDRLGNLTIGEYLQIPVIEYEAPTVDQIFEGVQFIDKCIKNGEKIYIHCREGISRASTFAVAYYLRTGLDLEDAIYKIQKTRPFINILPNQYQALINFQKELNNIKNS